MGRGNNNSLLYGGNLGALRSTSDPAPSTGIPDYHSLATRLNLIDTTVCASPNGSKIKKESYGDPDIDQSFRTQYFLEDGRLYEDHRQSPILGYDYINGCYYDVNDQKQPEHETQVPGLKHLLDQPAELDKKEFAHSSTEWNFPSQRIYGSVQELIRESYCLFDKRNKNHILARNPRLGPTEVVYYPSGRVESESYFTVGYIDGQPASTQNNPYGPSKITYFDLLSYSGKQLVKQQEWTKAITNTSSSDHGVVLISGLTEPGRCDGGPTLREFDEKGNIIREV